MDHIDFDRDRTQSYAHIGMKEEKFIAAFKEATKDRPNCCCICPLLTGSYAIICLLIAFNIALLIGNIMHFSTDKTISILSIAVISC